MPYLTATAIIDSNHKTIQDYAVRIVRREEEPVEMAKKLYLAVRDEIRYNPYSPFYLPEHYRASYVLRTGQSFCVPKASLLCALGRACGIPSRVGFATVRNHLATKQLLEFVGSNLFVYHGFVEFYLEDKWVKATPAFDKNLCIRHKVAPLEFNGREDSVFQAYNSENQKFMEYVEFHGSYADIPVDTIMRAWQKAYGEDLVKKWIGMYQEKGGQGLPGFEHEEVISD